MVIKKTPCKTSLGFIAPDQLLTKKDPDWSHFTVFGCKAWVINPKRTKHKDFLPPAEVGHLVGYSLDPIGWRIYIPSLNEEVVSVNVRFDENIPTPSEAYFADLKNRITPADPVEYDVKEFKKYVGRYYRDNEDGLLNKVMRISVLKDRSIVAYVASEHQKGVDVYSRIDNQSTSLM